MSLEDIINEPGPTVSVTMPVWLVVLICMAIIVACLVCIAFMIVAFVRRKKR